MNNAPFDIDIQLEGWDLLWLHLDVADDPTSPESIRQMNALRDRAMQRARERFELSKLSQNPTVQGVRRLFRQAGCDPTRYRPSSEALLRRVLKGGELPTIHPLVDFNNVVSIELAVPCCMMADGTITPPLVLRAGRDGESYLSLRGPFGLGGKPLMADQDGPFGTPITDSERVKVTPETHGAWLVAYLPRDATPQDEASAQVRQLLIDIPNALRSGSSLAMP